MKRIINYDSPTTNVFKEGIYNLNSYGAFLQNKIYGVQNISKDKTSYIIIFDYNFVTLQSIKLAPLCTRYTLNPLKSSYKIVIIGDGDIYIS